VWYEEKCKELGLETLRVRRTRQDLMLAKSLLVVALQAEITYSRQTDRPERVRKRHAVDPNSLVPTRYARKDMRKFSIGI
jgi:hypothetical protein